MYSCEQNIYTRICIYIYTNACVYLHPAHVCTPKKKRYRAKQYHSHRSGQMNSADTQHLNHDILFARLRLGRKGVEGYLYIYIYIHVYIYR